MMPGAFRMRPLLSLKAASAPPIPSYGPQQLQPRRNIASTVAQSGKEPFSPGTILKSDAGHAYKIEQVLAERRKPLLCVYRASADASKYIVKNMIPGEFEYQLDLQKILSACPNVRAVVDTVREQELFVYPFLIGDLLRLSRKTLSKATRKEVLRKALCGLADIHDRDILHNDIKPNNILVDYDEAVDGQVNAIKRVQISDLEDTVIVPPGKWLRDGLCGNQLWRSPESWVRAPQNQMSDVFSFGIAMIYVMVDEMVFRVSDEQLKAPDSWRYILHRHLSYFADKDGFNGLMAHIGEENPFYERLIELANDFPPESPRQPFEMWEYVEPGLRELVGKMTSLDPQRRIGAREALGHRWFTETD